ncbi:regulatory LuxR family protein [Litoreibacter ponti]|uniref:Regulatory LuxR family protein n=1 Tax=Litoreibacter ponti TaxID=1510457 RepID=A0A2T6BF09_9RHOB|nr:helix-turn-helix transcriptional regulator [Litoreibacter ponti]PTX54653.1 regulatory LuxR family protein [Litoreibacter ponti]
MSVSIQSEGIPALIQFSAMVFGATEPDRALQALADSIGVSSVAIYREVSESASMQLIAQNKSGSMRRETAERVQNTRKTQIVLLEERDDGSDFLVLNSRIARLLPSQIEMLQQSVAFLSGAWQARSAKFEQRLAMSDRVPTSSILHPSNPFGLTRTELRICNLISEGGRPKTIADTLQISMPTVRTHLRHIYSKTGFDGMLGVLHNLQSFAVAKDQAA